MAPLPPSRVASGMYPPSSTSAATIQYLNDRILTFASEWYFKPEGVELVRKRFEEDLRKRKLEAVHGWEEDDQTFRIRCHPGDVHRIWPLFYEVVAKIIKDEGGEEDDNSSEFSWTAEWVEKPFESALIERREDYLKRTGQDGTEDDAQSESSEVESEQRDGFPEEFVCFASKTTWPESENPNAALSLHLDAIAWDQMIKQLEALTGCRLVQSLKEGKIYIGGDSEKKCSAAVSKLDTLSKYQFMPIYQKHLFYNEGENNFKLILKPIADIKMHYFKTTLLEYLLIGAKCNYRTLPAAAAVRIAPLNSKRNVYVPVTRVHITPSIKLEDRDCGLTEWNDFKYCGIGQALEYFEDDSTLRQDEPSAAIANVTGISNEARVQEIAANKEIKDAIIERWADSVPVAVPIPLGYPLHPELEAASHLGSANGSENKPAWDNYQGFEGAPVLRHEFKVRQVSGGLMRNLSSMTTHGEVAPSSRILQPLVTQPSTPHHVSRPPSNILSKLPLAQVRTAGSSVSTTKSAIEFSPVPSSLGVSGIVSAADLVESPEAPHCENPFATTPAARNQESVGNKYTDIDEWVNKEVNRDPGRSLLDDDISVLEFTDPIMQPIQPATKSSEASQSLEKTPTLSESETRIFHITMNQRAPKSKSISIADRLPKPEPIKQVPSLVKTISAIDPHPDLLQELEESFRDLMKPAQGFRGQLQVQAEFGRILLNSINRKHISSKGSSEETKTPESLQRLLDSADFTSFTSVLTTSAGEMPYLLTLTAIDGTDLWEKLTPNWTVEYEFFFVENFADQPQSRFRVVIDAEEFGTQIRRHHNLGSLFVHGACRHWDFRVTATGVESDRGLEEEFGELATAVQSSLHVPSDSSTPNLSFSLDEAMSKRFELAAFRVYRTCRYKSKDGNSILNITEVQAPDIYKTSFSKEGLTLFKLLPGQSDRKPCEKPGLGYWYEVSISSSQLDSLLKHNETLELGEEAKWTPEGLSNLGFDKSIYLRACEMLKQMDGIGQYNNNEVEMRPAQAVMENNPNRKPKDDYW